MVIKSGNYVDRCNVYLRGFLDRIVFFFFFFLIFFGEHLVELKNKYPSFGFLHITGIVYKLSLHI